VDKEADKRKEDDKKPENKRKHEKREESSKERPNQDQQHQHLVTNLSEKGNSAAKASDEEKRCR
jgi:hypothetical protein